MGDGRLCGKCGKLGGADQCGNCLHCKRYHGEWYTGFQSLEELEAWRVANVSSEDREQARKWREEYANRISSEWRRSAQERGLGEDFVRLGAGEYYRTPQ